MTLGLEHFAVPREFAHLTASIAGCVVISWWSVEQGRVLLLLAQLFLLPLATSLAASRGDVGSPFCMYLVVHFATYCTTFSVDFWGQGWQYCIVALVFDLVVLITVRARTGCSTEVRGVGEQTSKMMGEMMRFLCDGYCALQSNGSILAISPGLASLLDHDVESAMTDWVGLPFQTLVSKDVAPEPLCVEQGTRLMRLMNKGGEIVEVETLTIRCPLPQELFFHILGQGLEVGSQEVFLRTISTRSSKRAEDTLHDLGVGRRLSGSQVGARDTRRQGCLSDLNARRHGCLSDLGASRVLSELGALHDARGPSDMDGSCVSSLPPVPRHMDPRSPGFAALVRSSRESSGEFDARSTLSAASDTPGKLSSRRLELMRGQAGRGDGASFMLELDVAPQTSSVLSGQTRARMRMRNWSGSRVDNDNDSVVSCSGVSLNRPVSEVTCAEEGEEDEELVETEVLGSQPTSDGLMRVQLGFKSRLLSQQRQELRSVSDELVTARRSLQRQGGMQAEQTEILKNFRKIVTRTANEVCGEGSPNVRISVVEPRDAVREKLEMQCKVLAFPHTAFPDIDSMVAAEDGESCSGTTGRLKRPDWSRSQFAASSAGAAAAPASPSEPSPSMVLRRFEARGPPARILLLSVTLLEALPADWVDRALIVLLSTDEDSEYMEWLLPRSLGDRAQERLRAWGVHQALRHPLSLEQLRTLARRGLDRQLGDDYLLVRQLGAGGTSQVYDTRRLRDGEVFALKEINVSRLVRRKSSQVDLDMVWKEVEVLRELSWPTVLHIVDAWWGEGAKALYMLLPAFGGGPLAKQVEAAAALRRPIALERIADWYAQTLHAVSYLHWCGVVHRDVKAENLLLQSSGHTLCLGDLGSAELLPDASPEACVKVSMTTPKITPPEVFLAGLHYAASDMWAVAATFCEVALLEPPLDVSIVDHEAVFQVAGLEPRLQDALAACARCSPGECPGGAPATDVLCAEMGQELRSMLQQDPRHRPSAASLVAGRRVYQRLQFVLRGAMPPEETDRHFQRLDQVIEESAQRPLAGPP